MIVYLMEQLDTPNTLNTFVRLLKHLTVITQPDVVLFPQSTAKHSASFLNGAMLFERLVSFPLEHVGLDDRLLGPTMQAQTYNV